VTGRPEATGRPGAVRWVGSAGRPAPGDPVGRAPPPGCRRSQAGAGWESAGARRTESGEPTCVPGRRPCGAAERSGPAGSQRRPPPARRPGRFRSRPLERPASPRAPMPRREARGWRPPVRDAPATPKDGRRPRPRPRPPGPSPGAVGRRRRPRLHAAPLPWHRRGRSPRGRARRALGRRRPVGWALAWGLAGRPGQASRGARSAVRRWAGRAGSAARVGPGGQVGLPRRIGPPGLAKPAERASMPASVTRLRRSTHPGTPAATRRRRRARPVTAGVRRLAGVAWMGGWVSRLGRAAGWLERMEAVRGSRGGLARLLGPTGPGPTRSAKPGCLVEAAGRPRAGRGPVRRPGWRASGPRWELVGSRPRWTACGCRGGR
jgi:hypothetical protein